MLVTPGDNVWYGRIQSGLLEELQSPTMKLHACHNALSVCFAAEGLYSYNNSWESWYWGSCKLIGWLHSTWTIELNGFSWAFGANEEHGV